MPILNKKKFLFIAVAVLLIIAAAAGIHYYLYIFRPNVSLENNKKSEFLYIPTGATFSSVFDSLSRHHYLKNPKSFTWLAEKRNYPDQVKPGRYRIREGMSNLDLVRLLLSGKQEPVMVVFNNIRTKEDLAGKISRQIEADSVSLLNLLNDPDYLAEFNATPSTVFRLFIPNSYEFYWNTSANSFIRRMVKEMKIFWTDKRIEKASVTGFTIDQVVTLASIVEKETNRNSEKPVIAGVYINRLHRDMPLQADPTLIFAMNDYTIKRVREEHKHIVSPYNTYLNKGLPPGPICLPSISSIDAVLDYKKHNFIYFCAREDLSGYHVFAVTFEEHTRNAARYRAMLNKMNIH
ncbi:MAG: endolytic transglycosylase MltG [Syntrophothermus sp.]